MKAIFTLYFILIFGAIALANTEAHAKVESFKMGSILDVSNDISKNTSETKNSTENRLARLYRSKNSRIKRALNFEPKNYDLKLV